MLRVFDPRAQLTPVQVGPHNPVKTACSVEIKHSYSSCTWPFLIEVWEGPYIHVWSPVYGAVLFPSTWCSDKHVDSKPVRPPPATHRGSSAIDLWLRSASCNLRCALPTGPSSPHWASATMNRSLNRSPRERRTTEPMGLCHNRQQRGSFGLDILTLFRDRPPRVFFNYWATRPVSGCRLSNL